MERHDPTRNGGAAAALVGGTLIVAGSMMTWAKLAMNMVGSGSQRETLPGMSGGDGKATLALGAIAIAVAAASIIVKKKGGLGTTLAVVSIAAGGLAFILGLMFALDIRAHALDYAIAQAGLKPADYAPQGRQILDAASAVSPGWGLYFVMVGGIVAALGGVLATINIRQGIADGAATDQPEEVEDVEAVGEGSAIES